MTFEARRLVDRVCGCRDVGDHAMWWITQLWQGNIAAAAPTAAATKGSMPT
jgi:hypothetical protein